MHACIESLFHVILVETFDVVGSYDINTQFNTGKEARASEIPAYVDTVKNLQFVYRLNKIAYTCMTQVIQSS